MHAIGNQIRENNPDANILYVNCERFVSDMVKALQHSRMNDFKNSYRSLDALLIDDIQFLADKEPLTGRVFPHLQLALRIPRTNGDHLRSLSKRNRRT